MAIWIDIARVAAALNVGLLVALGVVWGRNYRRLRSKHALGLLAFSGFLLVENLLWVYAYSVNPTFRGWLYDGTPFAQQAMMSLCVLESVGLLVLAWVTWD